MPFTFAMVLPGGERAGTFATSEPAWRAGDEVLVRPGERWRILATAPAPPDDPTLHGVWEVERAS